MYYDDYKDKVIDGQMCIWLQSYGYCPAKLATEFKVGDRIGYNFGISCEVVGIKEKSLKFLTFSVKNKDGIVYEQNVKKTSYKPYMNS